MSGVFLLVSIRAFLRQRPWQAVAWACLAAVLHATYLPAAAFLTLAYMVSAYRESGPRRALLLGSLSLALVTPSVIYNLAAFAPSSTTAFLEAQRILAQIRIPHHAVIERWFDGIALAQVLWIVAAILLTRGSRLFPLLAIPLACSLLLTLVQLATGSDTLALLFPWRTSTLLMPIATTVVLSRLVLAMKPWLQGLAPAPAAAFSFTSALLLIICVAGGLAIPVFELGYRTNRAELPLLEFVHAHHGRGDVYLVPVEVPALHAGAGGARSTNFTAAPIRGKSGHLIAIDLQQFRIATGAPLYVDFKSIPYKDEEVLEWHRRIEWCQKLYAGRDATAEELRAKLSGKGITHVIAPAASVQPFDRLGTPLYEDTAYCVFAVAGR